VQWRAPTLWSLCSACAHRWLGGDWLTMRSSRQARRGPREGSGHGEVAGCSPSRWRNGEVEKTRRRRVPVDDELRWPAGPIGRPYSTRDPRRGEGRSATRTRVARGVSSPKSGEDGCGGFSGGFRRWRGREVGGKEVGCLRRSRKEKGEGRKARVAVMGQHPFEWVRQMWGTAGEGVPRGERGMGGGCHRP
jgi:hypothetical protein